MTFEIPSGFMWRRERAKHTKGRSMGRGADGVRFISCNPPKLAVFRRRGALPVVTQAQPRQAPGKAGIFWSVVRRPAYPSQ